MPYFLKTSLGVYVSKKNNRLFHDSRYWQERSIIISLMDGLFDLILIFWLISVLFLIAFNFDIIINAFMGRRKLVEGLLVKICNIIIIVLLCHRETLCQILTLLFTFLVSWNSEHKETIWLSHLCMEQWLVHFRLKNSTHSHLFPFFYEIYG